MHRAAGFLCYLPLPALGLVFHPMHCWRLQEDLRTPVQTDGYRTHHHHTTTCLPHHTTHEESYHKHTPCYTAKAHHELQSYTCTGYCLQDFFPHLLLHLPPTYCTLPATTTEGTPFHTTTTACRKRRTRGYIFTTPARVHIPAPAYLPLPVFLGLSHYHRLPAPLFCCHHHCTTWCTATTALPLHGRTGRTEDSVPWTYTLPDTYRTAYSPALLEDSTVSHGFPTTTTCHCLHMGDLPLRRARGGARAGGQAAPAPSKDGRLFCPWFCPLPTRATCRLFWGSCAGLPVLCWDLHLWPYLQFLLFCSTLHSACGCTLPVLSGESSYSPGHCTAPFYRGALPAEVLLHTAGTLFCPAPAPFLPAMDSALPALLLHTTHTCLPPFCLHFCWAACYYLHCLRATWRKPTTQPLPCTTHHCTAYPAISLHSTACHRRTGCTYYEGPPPTLHLKLVHYPVSPPAACTHLPLSSTCTPLSLPTEDGCDQHTACRLCAPLLGLPATCTPLQDYLHHLHTALPGLHLQAAWDCTAGTCTHYYHLPPLPGYTFLTYLPWTGLLKEDVPD